MRFVKKFEEEHEEIEDEKNSTPRKRHFSAEKSTPGETLILIWMNEHYFVFNHCIERRV